MHRFAALIIASAVASTPAQAQTAIRISGTVEKLDGDEAQGERHNRLLVPLAIVVAIVNGTAPADLTVTGLAKDRELQPVDFP
jgi:hypothetical protein